MQTLLSYLETKPDRGGEEEGGDGASGGVGKEDGEGMEDEEPTLEETIAQLSTHGADYLR